MPFNTLPQNYGDGNNLPWANDYLESNPKQLGTTHDVREIKPTKKGLIISTESFAAFIYKSKQMHDYLLEFCKAWVGTKQPVAVLQVQLSDTLPFVIVGIEPDRSAYWGSTEQGGYWQTYKTVHDNPNYARNPLPLPSPSTANLTTTGEGASSLTPPPEPSKTAEKPLEEAGSPLNSKKRIKTPEEG